MNMNSSGKLIAILAFSLLGGLCACNKENPEAVKEKTAEATANLKQNAMAVAEGVREGWGRNKTVDLNTASKEQLAALPAVTPTQADRIIASRPYNDPHELVTRRILRQTEYEKISGRVTAKR
jgi:competence protein ComEA